MMMNRRMNSKNGIRFHKTLVKIIMAAMLSLVLGTSLAAVSPATAGAAQKKSIKNAAVTIAKSFEYTGKAIKPTVTVKVGGKKLNANKDYTLKYGNNSKVGVATVAITGKGSFTGTVKKTFLIVPKSILLKKYTLTGTTVNLEWAVVKNDVTGYQIRYSTDKNLGKDVKAITVKGASKSNVAVKGLKENSTYYFQVRAYKTASGKNYFSMWSGTKTAKSMTVKIIKPHMCHFVAKTHTEDRGHFVQKYEFHVICFKCKEILDDLTAREIMEQHYLTGCKSDFGPSRVYMGDEWISVPTDVIEFYYCPECGNKKPA